MKKFLSTLLILCILSILIMFLSGCSSTTTVVKEFDLTTGKVMKETVTKADGTLANITSSTQNKSILVWNTGWFFWLEFTPGNIEDPTPHGKLKGGNIDSGILLLHKDQQHIEKIAPVILATRSNVNISTTGANSTAGKLPDSQQSK